jgi:hypothetical protein
MKINITILVSIFLLSPFLLGNSGIVFACTPIYRTAQESLNGADLVFQGKVLSSAASTDVLVFDGTTVPTKVSVMDFEVKRFWKGNPTERVIVKSSALDGYSCPVFIPKSIGMEYLVYAKKDVNSSSYTVEYTEIKEASSATTDLNFLGNSKALKQVIKDNAPVVPVKSNSSLDAVNKSEVKPITQVNVQADSQSDIVETESNVSAEVKQNFIQRILSWFGGLLSSKRLQNEIVSPENITNKSGWVTHTNLELGIMFTAPKDYLVNFIKQRKTIDNTIINEVVVTPTGIDATKVHFFSTNVSIDKAKNIHFYTDLGIKNSEFRNITFDGYPGIKRIDYYSDNDCINELTAFSKGETVYGHHIVLCPTHPEGYDQIRKDIANSFSFIRK